MQNIFFVLLLFFYFFELLTQTYPRRPYPLVDANDILFQL